MELFTEKIPDSVIIKDLIKEVKKLEEELSISKSLNEIMRKRVVNFIHRLRYFRTNDKQVSKEVKSEHMYKTILRENKNLRVKIKNIRKDNSELIYKLTQK